MSQKARAAAAELRAYALGFPGAREEHPWGESVAKVGAKIFVFLGREGSGEWGCSVKLPHSATAALDRPFAEPTGYGLGQSGWVSVRFGEDERVPLDLLRSWVEESYRAIAPKKLVKELDASKGAGAAAPKALEKAREAPPAARRATRKKAKRVPKTNPAPKAKPAAKTAAKPRRKSPRGP